MAAKLLPDAETLRNILDYNPETGKLFWRQRDVSLFNETASRTREHACAHWNARWAGAEAFTASQTTGHKFGSLLGASYLAHRVIWKIVTGRDPEVIDHIDGDPGNNKWANLRSVSQLINARNIPQQKNCRHDHPGVYYTGCKFRPWRAAIGHSGKIRRLGAFASKEAAVAARVAAEAECGYIIRK